MLWALRLSATAVDLPDHSALRNLDPASGEPTLLTRQDARRTLLRVENLPRHDVPRIASGIVDVSLVARDQMDGKSRTPISPIPFIGNENKLFGVE
jgi:hypothetical protein